jgi:hypothetical protein
MTLEGQICSRELTCQDGGVRRRVLEDSRMHHLTGLRAGSSTVLYLVHPACRSEWFSCRRSGPMQPLCRLSRRGRLHGRTDIGANMIPGIPDPHLAQIRPVRVRTPQGCEECLSLGTPWVHLRLCLSCGHVGCCDSSPMRHARAHATELHPIVRSLEPGEDWRWCYPHEAFV